MKDKRKIQCIFFISSLLLAGCNYRQNLSVKELPTQNIQERVEVVTPDSAERVSKKDNDGLENLENTQSNDGNSEQNDIINSIQSEKEKRARINTEKVNQIIEELNTEEKILEVIQK